MSTRLPMEPEKVETIHREQNPVFGYRERQNLIVGHGRIGLASLEGCQNVVP